MDISQLIIRNKRERYELELEYTEDEITKNQIQTILQKLEKPTESKIDKFDNKIDQIELLSMKKQFYRLKEPQKLNRLEKYFTEKHNITDTESKKFANQILELLNNSTLKSKDIDYDSNNAIVNNISNIEIITNDNKFEIKLITKSDKPKKIIKKKKTEE
jgi:hypothetical protein